MLLQGADGAAQGAPCGLIHQHRGDGQLPDAARIGQQHCNEHREAHRHQLHRGGAGLGILCLICGLLSILFKEMTLKSFFNLLAETMESSATILFLIAASSIMSYVMSYSGITAAISNALMSVSSNR